MQRAHKKNKQNKYGNTVGLPDISSAFLPTGENFCFLHRAAQITPICKTLCAIHIQEGRYVKTQCPPYNCVTFCTYDPD